MEPLRSRVNQWFCNYFQPTFPPLPPSRFFPLHKIKRPCSVANPPLSLWHPRTFLPTKHPVALPQPPRKLTHRLESRARRWTQMMSWSRCRGTKHGLSVLAGLVAKRGLWADDMMRNICLHRCGIFKRLPRISRLALCMRETWRDVIIVEIIWEMKRYKLRSWIHGYFVEATAEGVR